MSQQWLGRFVSLGLKLGSPEAQVEVEVKVEEDLMKDKDKENGVHLFDFCI